MDGPTPHLTPGQALKRIGARFMGWMRGRRPRRTLRFTRFGVTVVVVAFGVGFAAMNTGNNLLYLVMGMVLGLILASGLVSEHAIKTAKIEWILPGESFAGRESTLRLLIVNPGRRPLLGLVVSVQAHFPGGQVAMLGPAPFLIVPGFAQRAKDFVLKPASRGRLVLKDLKLTTTFPFGFFEKSLQRTLGAEWLVYPAPAPFSDKASAAENPRRRRQAPERGQGDSFWGLREFRPGDHPRQVAWKTAAKRGQLLVRETERETERRLTLSVGAAARWLALSPQEREQAISVGSAFVMRKSAEGMALGFYGPGISLEPGIPGARRSALRYLALFDPGRPAPAAAEPPKSVDLLSLWKSTR